MDAQQQNIFNLKLYDLFIFPISWLIFVIIGRVFFENGLGRYHSTHSKKWASLCKSLFLLTFVTCCTLLELVTFEILDLLHPALRLFFWTTSLAILALLLNALIPAVLAVSMGFHINLSVNISIFLGCCSVCIFQLLMWLTGSLLHHYQSVYYAGLGLLSAGLENVDISNISSPSIMKWVFMFDRENANNIHNTSYFTPLLLFMDLILQFDVQQSIANIALIGTICAAIISGFATVFFPLEQLLIFRGVDAEQLRRREQFLSEILREIATRKKELLTISTSTPPVLSDVGPRTNSRISDSSSINHSDRRNENLSKSNSGINSAEKEFKDTQKEVKKKEKHSLDTFDTIDRDPEEKNKNKKNITSIPYDGIQNIIGSCCSPSANPNLIHFNKNVLLLEELSISLFGEIVALKEQQYMAQQARTQWGRVMRFCGQVLTVVAIARLLIGAWHVFDHLKLAIVLLKPSDPIGPAGSTTGLDDVYSVGAVISSNQIVSPPTADYLGAIGLTDGIEDPGSTDTGIFGLGSTAKNEQGDLVTTSLSFLLVHLKIDGTAWAPFLSSVFIGSMALLQVRAFLVAMEQLARLGIMSTSTELYSLALALLTGFYFMACVWQLSFQLPLRCRRGVIAALGESAPFELFFILFDIVFIFSTIFFGVLLWVQHRRKLLLSYNVSIS